MIINTYKKYILSLFSKTLIEVTLIFFSLILLINIFEEINFFRNENVTAYYPLFLSMLLGRPAPGLAPPLFAIQPLYHTLRLLTTPLPYVII